MMRIRIGVLFGGQSPEHEVSIRSAQTVIEHLSPEKYEIFPIGIDKKGRWHFFNPSHFFPSIEQNRLPIFEKEGHHFPLAALKDSPGDAFFSFSFLKENFDVIFPMLHGPFGEDGTVQGLMQLANVPYVGSDVLSSALCMDKAMMKQVLRAASLPLPRFISLHREDSIDQERIIGDLKLPLFVKPANMGSSIGISKVSKKGEFGAATKKAFSYDERILVEEAIEGREIECSVLGNLDPIASLPGEIIPAHSFYSYEAKYLDQNGATFHLPAFLGSLKTREIQRLAIRAFKTLRCEGMARVDFFLKPSGEVFINEVNTLPGFTEISLYPKLWEVSGLFYSELIEQLIALALERFKRRAKLNSY